MKNDIIIYKLGSFIDFKGDERLVIAAAVSQPVANGLKATWDDGETVNSITRAISIGIAVYNPNDEFDLQLGEKTAVDRAYKSNPRWYIAEQGFFNDAATCALLDDAIDYFANHPETVIKGYAKAAADYAKIKESEKAIDEMTEEEMAIVDAISNGVDVINVAKKAMPFLNAEKNGSSLVD